MVLGQHNKDKALEDVLFKYDVFANSMEGVGHNPGIFEVSISMAVYLESAETETIHQVKQQFKSGPGQGIDSCIRNEVLSLLSRAQKQQLKLNEAVQLKAADRRVRLS
jgi:hypothetical protein